MWATGLLRMSSATGTPMTASRPRGPHLERSVIPFVDPQVLAVVATLQDLGVIVTLRFSNQLVAELVQPFWAALQAGEFLTDAAVEAGARRGGGPPLGGGAGGG